MPGLSNEQVDVLTFLEQKFWEDGMIPTNEAAAEETGVSLVSIKRYWQDDLFRTALQARGVSQDNRPDKKALTMMQLMAANAMMNLWDRRSMREKCKELKITPAELAGWMRQPAFQEHLKKRAATILDTAEPAAHRGLVQAIEAGDLKAITLFYEMKGIYNPRLQVDVNVSVVLTRVVEIVSKHVTDPAILMAIATDIEALEGGPAIGAALPQAPLPEAAPEIPLVEYLPI